MLRKPEIRADVLYCTRLLSGTYWHYPATITRVIDADRGWVDLAVDVTKRDDRFEDGSGDTPQILHIGGVLHADYHRPVSWHYLGEVN